MTTVCLLRSASALHQPVAATTASFSSLGAASAASSRFVPKHVPASSEDISLLSDWVREASPGLLLLTGAGISTESGVPDYRSAEVGLFARSNRKPVQHSVYMRSPEARKSFWARSFVGWPRWSALTPNAAHRALSDWERRGVVTHVVTQNVDQLHYKAGSQKVIELHGTNSRVACTSCSYSVTRQAFQHVLTECNPEIAVSVAETEGIRPDGDVDIPQSDVDRFVVPSCPRCSSGVLKPSVVFFGDNVPSERVKAVSNLVKDCHSLLVVGSSLFVFSGYRFIVMAKELGKRVGIVNIGSTRGDAHADLKIHAKAGDILPYVLF